MNRIVSYRSINRLMVMLLILGSISPTAVHACMMALGHDGHVMEECCCERDEDAMHREMGHEMPMPDCDDDQSHHEGESGDMHGDCCKSTASASLSEAVSANKIVPPDLLVAPVFLVVVQGSSESGFPGTARFRDLGPPPLSSPPLHILFAQLLN